MICLQMTSHHPSFFIGALTLALLLCGCGTGDTGAPSDNATSTGDGDDTGDGTGDTGGGSTGDTGTDSPPLPESVDASGGLWFEDASAALAGAPTGVTGVSLADFDRDGLPDVTLADRSGVRVYRNAGGSGFALVDTVPPGPEQAIAPIWADVDGDGQLDLLITTRGGTDRLLRQADGNFEDISASAGLTRVTFAEGASFGDLDGDGDLDLVICQAVDYSANPEDPVSGGNGHPNLAYRNDGGVFTDMTQAWGLAGTQAGETFMALMADVEGDGDQDVFQIHDHIADQLLLNTGNGTFEDSTGDKLPTEPTSLMGIDIADFDGDGRLDVYGTTVGRDILYLQGVDGVWSDEYFSTIGAGFDSSATLTGWGAAFLDADNDGDLDVMTTAAYSDAYTSEAVRPGYLVLLQHEERPVGPRALIDIGDESGEVFARSLNGWGLAVADFDRDGDLDALVGVDTDIDEGSAPDEPHTGSLLLRNTSPAAAGRSWLRIGLRLPDGANILAVGATVTVEIPDLSVSRVVTAGTSYASQHEYDLHFGLNTNSTANVVRVRWPGGETTLWGGMASGAQVLTYDAGERCCVEGACSDLAEPACRDHIAQVLGFTDGCASACAKLDTCGLLADEGLANAEECTADCASDPPPAEALTCLASADCDGAPDCLAE
ncbi:MAG: hypothetical protein ACI9WU_002293 [Myxococcota bacterium]|jgi:hypothetical protein